MMMTNVILFLSVLLAVVFGALWCFSVLVSKRRCADLTEKANLLNNELQQSTAKLENLTTQLNSANVAVAVGETKAQNAQARLDEASKRISEFEIAKENSDKLIAAQERELKIMRETINETEARYVQMRKSLNDDFQILANKIFDSTREKFVVDNAEKLSAVVNPLAENIADFRKRVESIHEAEIRSSEGVSAQIKSLVQMNTRLSDEAHNLAQALRSNNKIAGNWGETILERIFEDSGFIKGVHYRTQVNFSDSTSEQSRLMPDFIVDLPDNRSIIVDSKLSLVDYVDYCSSENTEHKRVALEKFKKSVRSHLKDFAKKYNTISSVAGFKLMFMPIEPAYNLIIENDKTLLVDAYRENVIIVSPVSVMAILKYAQIAYRSEAFVKNIAELSKQGQNLCARIERFMKHFNAIQDKINSVQKAFDDSKKSLIEGSQSVANTAKRFYELTVKSNTAETKKIEEQVDDE